MLGKGGAKTQFRGATGGPTEGHGAVDEFTAIAGLRARFEAVARLPRARW